MVRSLALPVVLLFAPAAFAQSPGVHSPGAGEHEASPTIAIREVAPDVLRTSVEGRWVVFTRDETTLDLNGDGDTSDEVFMVHDLVSGTTTNLGLAGRTIRAVGGGRALISVRESWQGATDLNADGDTIDTVVFGVDLASASATNSGFAESSQAAGIFVGARAVFVASESLQGATDLDGNGVVSGVVPVVWADFGAAPVVVPLAISPSDTFTTHESFVLVRANEALTGDKNGDGDALDDVLHVIDLDDPTLTPIDGQFAVTRMEAVGSRSAFLVDEEQQGVDLNGDGDLLDQVLHVFDVGGGGAVNLGFAVDRPSVNVGHGVLAFGDDFELSTEAVAFHVNEFEQGSSDLNGDGDTDDSVVFVHDFATGTTLDLGLASFHLVLGPGALAFAASEYAQGADLDGDGAIGTPQADHLVTYLHQLATQSTLDVGLAVNGPNAGPFVFTGSKLACLGLEAGVDENGDGDGTDTILFLVDVASGAVSSQHVAVQSTLFVTNGWLSLRVREADEGRDIDHDGDVIDTVLVFLRLESGERVETDINVNPFGGALAGFGRRHPFVDSRGVLGVLRLRL